jgi:quercetin dioxygenase-like cupin family protein
MKQWICLVAGGVLGSALTAGAPAVSSSAYPAQDPVKQSPQFYKVLLENDEVRVLEFRAKPGEKEPAHSHPAVVVYQFEDSKVRSTQDGKTQELVVKAGEALWRPPVTHSFENIGETDVHALVVELKHAPASR